MTYFVPPNVMQQLTRSLLGTLGQWDPKSRTDPVISGLYQVLDDHSGTLPPDTKERICQICAIRLTILSRSSARKTVPIAGDKRMADLRQQETAALETQAQQLTKYMGFSFPAELLCKAVSLEDFAAQVSRTDLSVLYGFAPRPVSPFPLIWAISARSKALERVQLMLAAGASVTLRTGMGETVLHAMAAMNRKAKSRLSIMRFLVFKGADLEAVTIKGETPLTTAVRRGSTEDVAHFLAVGARVREVDCQSASTMPEKLKLLVEHLSEANEKSVDVAGLASWIRGEIAHYESIYMRELAKTNKRSYHHIELEKLHQSLALVTQSDNTAQSRSKRRYTWGEEPAAFWAVQSADDLDSYRGALSRVQIETFTMPGTHPIYWPIEAKENRLQRMWLMLCAGASVDGGENGSALHIFAKTPRIDLQEQDRMGQMLVQSRASLDARDYSGRTPLDCAIGEGNLREAAVLFRLGAVPKLSLTQKRTLGHLLHNPDVLAAVYDPRIFRFVLQIAANQQLTTDDTNRLRGGLITTAETQAKLLKSKTKSKQLERCVKQNVDNLQRSLEHLLAINR